MAASSIMVEVKRVLAAVLERAIADTDSIDTVPEWDSVRHLTVVLALEQQFGLTFDAAEIPYLTSVDAIADALAAHGVR